MAENLSPESTGTWGLRVSLPCCAATPAAALLLWAVSQVSPLPAFLDHETTSQNLTKDTESPLLCAFSGLYLERR